jgi:hypothetical protein
LKLHLHVGVIRCEDEDTLDHALAAAGLTGKVLDRPAPEVAVLEKEDAAALVTSLNDRGLHPKVMR